MPLPIFYQANIASTDAIILNEETSKHCIQVLRMEAGNELIVTDGKGNIYTCTIASAHKKNTVVSITTHEQLAAAAAEKVIAISLLKNASRFEWFVEKAVELGITAIVPLLCSRTEKQQFKYERVHNIVVSAMLQSQQFWLPTLYKPTTFKEAIALFKNYSQPYIAHCYNNAPKQILPNISTTSNCITFIGPEGDFTVPEISYAIENNFTALSLGNTRLRTETAALKAAVAMCL
jgi:16S rRNA (uracil1498-N3)-methyltransferase